MALHCTAASAPCVAVGKSDVCCQDEGYPVLVGTTALIHYVESSFQADRVAAYTLAVASF